MSFLRSCGRASLHLRWGSVSFLWGCGRASLRLRWGNLSFGLRRRAASAVELRRLRGSRPLRGTTLSEVGTRGRFG